MVELTACKEHEVRKDNKRDQEIGDSALIFTVLEMVLEKKAWRKATKAFGGSHRLTGQSLEGNRSL